MLFGFDISSMSAIIGTKQYNEFFHTPVGIHQGAIGSALAAGSVVGSIIAGPISNWIGRRDSIAFACLWWLAGTAVQTSTNGFGMSIAGRLLNGVCVGITSSQVPVYLAEIAKHDQRGAIIIIQQLAIEWGILIMYVRDAPSVRWLLIVLGTSSAMAALSFLVIRHLSAQPGESSTCLAYSS